MLKFIVNIVCLRLSIFLSVSLHMAITLFIIRYRNTIFGMHNIREKKEVI